ncbi:MAG TPA: tetratricopeptide repeat protein [bacterium]|nr:tetratricopeptide repeat protein [bacterium]
MSRLRVFILLLVLAAIGAGFYLVPRKRPFESYTVRASDALQNKDFEQSIELYLKALRLYPDHARVPEILLIIGDIYNFSLANSEKAAKAYDMLTTRFSKTEQARLAFEHAAEMHEKNEAFEKALLAYQGLIDNFPDSEDLDGFRFKVAMMAAKLKKFEPARRSLMAIIDQNPDTPIADQVLFQIGNLFFMEGAAKQAVQVLEVAAEKYPDSPLQTEMLFTAANAHEEQGQIDKALKIYRQIRYTYPNPRVIEKKLDKLADRQKEVKAMEARSRQGMRMAGPLPPGAESKPSPKSGVRGRKKTQEVDKSLLELMEGEP